MAVNEEYNVTIDRKSTTKITKRIQIRFPRSKKKRIRNKWANKEENFIYRKLYKPVVLKDRVVIDQKTFENIINNYK